MLCTCYCYCYTLQKLPVYDLVEMCLAMATVVLLPFSLVLCKSNKGTIPCTIDIVQVSSRYKSRYRSRWTPLLHEHLLMLPVPMAAVVRALLLSVSDCSGYDHPQCCASVLVVLVLLRHYTADTSMYIVLSLSCA
jgi:hypothetical protein